MDKIKKKSTTKNDKIKKKKTNDGNEIIKIDALDYDHIKNTVDSFQKYYKLKHKTAE